MSARASVLHKSEVTIECPRETQSAHVPVKEIVLPLAGALAMYYALKDLLTQEGMLD